MYIITVQRCFVSACFCGSYLTHGFLQTEPATAFTVKLRGVPFNVKEVRAKQLQHLRLC